MNTTKRDNATWLFERETSGANFPNSSESFWSALFGLFLTYLGARGNSEENLLKVWAVTDPDAPSFRKSCPIDVGSVGFDDIAVEPGKLDRKYFREGIDLPPEARRCEPDLFVRLRSTDSDAPTHLLIENKTIRAPFDAEQQAKYLQLLEVVDKEAIRPRMLLLTSAFPENKILFAAHSMQHKLHDKFGLLLWEDIIGQMNRTGFSPAGVNVGEWQRYTDAFRELIEPARV
jgi:hypothetical protein